jgi:hypothetical protein
MSDCVMFHLNINKRSTQPKKSESLFQNLLCLFLPKVYFRANTSANMGLATIAYISADTNAYVRE